MSTPAKGSSKLQELNDRLEEARNRAKQLREQIEEHQRRMESQTIHTFASSAGVGPWPGPSSLQELRTLKGHFGKVYALHWAGKSVPFNVVSASQDGKLIVWNAFTTNKKHSIPLRSAWVMTCAFEKSASRLVACGGLDNVCSVYNLADEHNLSNPAHELTAHDGYLSCARFLDESQILTSSGDSTCILWDLEAEKPLRTFSDHSADVMGVSLNPGAEKTVFVSASCDASAKLWDVREERCVKSFLGHVSDINSVSFFPDGNSFATGSDDSTCRMFDIRACGEVARFTQENILCGITSVAFSLSGRLLFAGYDDYNCYVWDVLNEAMVMEVKGHGGRVSCVDVSADGLALCTGGWDTLLKVWSVA